MQNRILPFILISTLFACQFVQAETISRLQAETLMAQCHVFRKQQIQPYKELEIDKCINKQGKEADYCARFYSGYGETQSDSNGQLQIGLFWGSPICDKALIVEKYFKMYPGKDKYEYEK
jgi:hypothetical protein